MIDQVYWNIGSLDQGQLRQVAETLAEIANDSDTRDQSYRTINIRREGRNDVVYEVDAKTGACGTGFHRRITLRTPPAQTQPTNPETFSNIKNPVILDGKVIF